MLGQNQLVDTLRSCLKSTTLKIIQLSTPDHPQYFTPIASALAGLSHEMSASFRGEAIFSTRLGQLRPREAIEPRGPIVLRSEPEDDLETVIARLEQDFPVHCKTITLPIINIYDYFDHYDCHVLGTGFLHKVLETIVFRNFTRSEHVQHFVRLWKDGKLGSFERMTAAPSLHDVFTETEIENYGEGVLREALASIGDLMRLDLGREGTVPFHSSDTDCFLCSSATFWHGQLVFNYSCSPQTRRSILLGFTCSALVKKQS